MRKLTHGLAAVALAATLAVAPLSSSVGATGVDRLHQQTWLGWAKSWVGWAGGLFGWAINTVESDLAAFRDTLINDADRIDKTVAMAGFSLDSVRIGMGLLPDIDLDLSYERTLTTAERDALFKRLDASGEFGAIESALLYALLDIVDNHQAKKDATFALSSVEISVDLIPQVGIVLTRVKPSDKTDGPAVKAAPVTKVTPAAPAKQ